MTYVHYVAILTVTSSSTCIACSSSDVLVLGERINGVSLVVLSCEVRDGLRVRRSCTCSRELWGLSFDRPCIMEIRNIKQTDYYHTMLIICMLAHVCEIVTHD